MQRLLASGKTSTTLFVDSGGCMAVASDFIVNVSLFVASDSPGRAAQVALDEIRDLSVGPWEASVARCGGFSRVVRLRASTPDRFVHENVRRPTQQVSEAGLSGYMVNFEVGVTAIRSEQAVEFAFADLRDRGLGPWNADVCQVKFSQPQVHSCGDVVGDDSRLTERMRS